MYLHVCEQYKTPYPADSVSQEFLLLYRNNPGTKICISYIIYIVYYINCFLVWLWPFIIKHRVFYDFFFDYLLDIFSVFRKTNFSIKMPDFPPVIRRIPSTWKKIATSKYLINLTYFIIYWGYPLLPRWFMWSASHYWYLMITQIVI